MEARKQREGEKETVAAEKELGRRTTFIPVPVDDVMAQRATFGFFLILCYLAVDFSYIRPVTLTTVYGCEMPNDPSVKPGERAPGSALDRQN